MREDVLKPQEVTAEDILRAIKLAFALPENKIQKRSKPRASGLTGCLRNQQYQMIGAKETDEPSADSYFTQEQGRLAEDITVAALGQCGIPIINRQIALPEDFWVTGHPDGEIAGYGGFEHKHFGRYRYKRFAQFGLESAIFKEDVAPQIVCYAQGLGWERCLLVVTSQDASSIRVENRYMTKKAQLAKYHSQNVKMIVFDLEMAPLIDRYAGALKDRATNLSMVTDSTLGTAKEKAVRAFNPDSNFKPDKGFYECDYCNYRGRCLDDGP